MQPVGSKEDVTQVVEPILEPLEPPEPTKEKLEPLQSNTELQEELPDVLPQEPNRKLTQSPPTTEAVSWEKKEQEYKEIIQLLRSQLETKQKKTWSLGKLLTINVLPPESSIPTTPDGIEQYIQQLTTQLQYHKTLSGATQSELTVLKEDLNRIRKEREKEKKDVEFRIKKMKWEVENKIELVKSANVPEQSDEVHNQLTQQEDKLREKDEEIARLRKEVEEASLDQRIARQRSRSRQSSPAKPNTEELEMWTNKCHSLEVQLHLLQRKLADQTSRNASLKNLIVNASLGPSTPVASPMGLNGDALVLANYAELQKQANSMKAELERVKLKNEEMSFVMGQLVEECERLEQSEATTGNKERRGSDMAKTILAIPTNVDLNVQLSKPTRKPSTILVAKRMAGDASARPEHHYESFQSIDVRMCCKKCGEEKNPSKFIVL
jgi:hypothetical protein